MRRALISAATWLLLVASQASADVIELKTGQRVEGSFKQATSGKVSIEVGGQTITFEQEKVRAIYFGGGPAPNAPPLSAALEALRVLKALQSVVVGGVTYRDYAPRVSDAKIVVDRYLGEPNQTDAVVKAAIKETLGFYVLASSAWNAKIIDRTVLVAGDPMAERCPALKDMLAKWPYTGNLSISDETRGVIISTNIPVIWHCAADQTAEAERLLSGERSQRDSK
jgi:hypothetical protein